MDVVLKVRLVVVLLIPYCLIICIKQQTITVFDTAGIMGNLSDHELVVCTVVNNLVELEVLVCHWIPLLYFTVTKMITHLLIHFLDNSSSETSTIPKPEGLIV